MKEGYLFEDGYFFEFIFSNMVFLAFKFEYYEWVEVFIGNYFDKLKLVFWEFLFWYIFVKLVYEFGDIDCVL